VSDGGLRLRYFAWLRERLGMAEEVAALPAGVATVGELMAWLATRGGGFAAAFDGTARVRCAVNQEFARADTKVAAGDEVAFFPPVTGG
jgi:molybdopterin synthase sulfur carrier subunit